MFTLIVISTCQVVAIYGDKRVPYYWYLVDSRLYVHTHWSRIGYIIIYTQY